MLGVRLFIHAFTMLFHDFWATVRLILFPLLIGVVLIGGLFFLLGNVGATIGANGPDETTVGFVAAILISLVIAVFVVCWSAVGWHRYVLLQERPGALLPKVNGPFLRAYLWAGVKVFLIALLLFVPVVILAVPIIPQLVNEVNPRVFILVNVVLSIVFAAIFFRVTLIMPAAAVGNPLTIGESWKATKGYFWAFVIVAVASNALNFLANVIGGDGLVALALSLLFNLLSFAVGVSILTTLYGACIEQRELA